MIHHELGGAYVLEDGGAGGQVRAPVDFRDPRAAAMAAEEADGGDAMLCMLEAARDWLGWIFEAGPHPLAAMRRLVACTSVHAPWLLQGMPAGDARALSPLASESQGLRRVCRATPRQVHEALAAAHRRLARGEWAAPAAGEVSSLEMKLVVESAIAGDEALLRGKAMGLWLARLWDCAPDARRWRPSLRNALKALYVDARALAPELILNMSGEEIAALFRQGRGAESARVKQRVNVRLLRAGFRRTTLRFQKSETACRAYAARAKGNRNRSAGSASSRQAVSAA